MLQDIETREDLTYLLSEFYKVATIDKEIGHHFTGLDLELHLPVIVDFWEKILFGKPVYFNNPMAVHKFLHKISPLKPKHFQRWLNIFGETIDRNFAGEMSENAKVKAQLIARSLNQNLNEVDVFGGYIQIEN